MSKIKVFYLSFYPPTPTMGGAMAFYRHFFVKDDFDVFVATTDMDIHHFDLPAETLVFHGSRTLQRIKRSRLSLVAHTWEHFFSGSRIPAEVETAARKFDPDYIFTIAGSWNWTAQMAGSLGRKLGVPVVGSFNDWADYNNLILPSFRKRLVSHFRRFYRRCEVALCTSEGMRNELGHHPNAHVLYPCGSMDELCDDREYAPRPLSERFSVGFGGNLFGWYGEMILSLYRESVQQDRTIDFQIFGGNAGWDSDVRKDLEDKGVYRGLVPFEVLRNNLEELDCLILTMGFGSSCEVVEKTSFKTKFLDYVTMNKPIFVWGPEYCTAVKVAQEFDSAEVCIDPNPVVAAERLLSLARSPERCLELVENAKRMYLDRFHPDVIHGVLKSAMPKITSNGHTPVS